MGKVDYLMLLANPTGSYNWQYHLLLVDLYCAKTLVETTTDRHERATFPVKYIGIRNSVAKLWIVRGQDDSISNSKLYDSSLALSIDNKTDSVAPIRYFGELNTRTDFIEP